MHGTVVRATRNLVVGVVATVAVGCGADKYTLDEGTLAELPPGTTWTLDYVEPTHTVGLGLKPESPRRLEVWPSWVPVDFNCPSLSVHADFDGVPVAVSGNEPRWGEAHDGTICHLGGFSIELADDFAPDATVLTVADSSLTLTFPLGDLLAPRVMSSAAHPDWVFPASADSIDVTWSPAAGLPLAFASYQVYLWWPVSRTETGSAQVEPAGITATPTGFTIPLASDASTGYLFAEQDTTHPVACDPDPEVVCHVRAKRQAVHAITLPGRVETRL